MRVRLAVAAVAAAALPVVPAYADPVPLEAHCTFFGVLTPLNELTFYAVGVGAAPGAVRTEVTCRMVNDFGEIGRAARACTGPACAVTFATGGTVVSPALVCVSARAVAADNSVTVLAETCDTVLA